MQWEFTVEQKVHWKRNSLVCHSNRLSILCPSGRMKTLVMLQNLTLQVDRFQKLPPNYYDAKRYTPVETIHLKGIKTQFEAISSQQALWLCEEADNLGFESAPLFLLILPVFCYGKSLNSALKEFHDMEQASKQCLYISNIQVIFLQSIPILQDGQ